MIIYLSLLLIAVMLEYFFPKKITKCDQIIYIYMGFIISFRNGVGTDYYAYKALFETMDLYHLEKLEKSIKITSEVLNYFDFTSQVGFLIYGVLTILFYYKGINYFTKNKNISKVVFYVNFLLLVFFPAMNVIRQMLAGAIMFYATKYIVEKKFFKYCSFFMIAFFFHKSSIFFLPLYFIGNKKIKKNKLIMILFVFFIIAELDLIGKVLKIIVENFKVLDVNNYITTYLDS